MNQPPLLFDHQQLLRQRKRAAPSFAKHSVLYDEVAAELLERLQAVKRSFTHVLDLSSRHMVLSKHLQETDPKRFVVHVPGEPLAGAIVNLCEAQTEILPFAPASFDLVISNLALHWVNDLPGCLVQIRHALKPDGFFIAAMLGAETLHELRTSLAEAEIDIRGGASAHIAPFADLRDCAGLLQRAGFVLPVADKTRLVLTYPDTLQLMRELRGMGEGNALLAREKRFMPRALFARVEEIYRKRFGSGSGPLPATFDVLFLAGWAAPQA